MESTNEDDRFMVMRHGRAIATCHLWLFILNLDEKFSSSVTPVTFQNAQQSYLAK